MQRDYASHQRPPLCRSRRARGDRPARRRAGGAAARAGQARQRDDAGAVRPARRRQPDRRPARRDERPGDRPQDQLPSRPRGRAAVRPRASTSSTIRTGRRGLRSKPFDGEGVPTTAAPADRRRPAHRLAARTAPRRGNWGWSRPAMPAAASAARRASAPPTSIWSRARSRPAALMADIDARPLRHRADRPGRQSGDRRL